MIIIGKIHNFEIDNLQEMKNPTLEGWG